MPVGLREVASNDLGSLGLVDCQAPAPEDVVATSTGATSIDLSWDEVPDTTKYRIEYRSSGADGWTTEDEAITETAHSVDGLACSTVYEFQVSAFGDGDPYDANWSDAVRRQNKWDKRGAFKACNLDANRLRQFSDLPTSVRLDSFASPPVSSPVWRLAVRGTYPPA